MRRFVKKMTEFTIVSLHNPFECDKCCAKVKRNEELNKIAGKVISKKKLIKKLQQRYQTSFSLKTVSDKPEKKIFIQAEAKKVSNFKRLLEKSRSYPKTSPKKAKTEKNIYLKNITHQADKSCRKKSPKTGKKTMVANSSKSPTAKKQSNSSKKADEPKIPGKGTLKRKRWYFNQLKNSSNDNYEDDIFENEKFGHFQNLLEDETDSCEQYEGLKTPEFPCCGSPRIKSPTPPNRKCSSPTEVEISSFRKSVEEYQHRMNSRRKSQIREMKKTDSQKPKSDKKKDSDVQKTLEEVARILNEQKNKNNKSDSEEDDYFSDMLTNSSNPVS